MVLCVFCHNLVLCLLILRIGTRLMVGKKCARTQEWSWMDLVQTDFQRLPNASGKPEMRLEIKFSSETCFWHLLADVAAAKMQRYLALPDTALQEMQRANAPSFAEHLVPGYAEGIIGR